MVSPDLLPIPLLLPSRPGPHRVSEERGMLMPMLPMPPMAMATMASLVLLATPLVPPTLPELSRVLARGALMLSPRLMLMLTTMVDTMVDTGPTPMLMVPILTAMLVLAMAMDMAMATMARLFCYQRMFTLL